MNRRGNKILNELIWNEKLNISEFKEKYNVQERSIRLDIKGINDDLQKAGLPVISENSEGELELENKRQINIKEFEKFITKEAAISPLLFNLNLFVIIFFSSF